MKKNLVPLLAALTVLTATAYADPTVASLGGSITISDGNYAGKTWYGDHEDNETEANPYTIKGQDWDLEGMYLNGSALTLVGGYDFRAGNNYGGKLYSGGDIFVSVNGTPKYTQANNGSSGLNGTVKNSFGYDYVIHFNPAVTSYSVYQLNSNSILQRTGDVAASNPWRYYSGGTLVSGYANKNILGYGLLNPTVYGALTTFGSTSTGLQGYTDSKTGSWDNQHFYLSVSTSFLPSMKTTAYFHYTMECGNDDLMGSAHIPETSTTLLLVGASLVGFALLRRKTRLA